MEAAHQQAARAAHEPVRIGLLTSGGDAQGMNAAVRAVVRTALNYGAVPYAIHEGWRGAVDGGDCIQQVGWDDVGSVLHRGGTVIGTARCAQFRERDGMRAAARNLIRRGIDRLVVIGGDGSLTGADAFRREWPSLLEELLACGEIDAADARNHAMLMLVGLVGSIDNDLVGADSTIGADSALHRIIEAIDALSSTAASHQRSFVVEVMGRRCGYLPLMATIAGGCDYVLIPEQPPDEGWQQQMCASLQAGRSAGRRDSIVIVAEGAADRDGSPITAADVKTVIEEGTGEDTRVTILGHVQRGGTPSAYDRWMSTALGFHAVQDVLHAGPQDPAQILAVHGNRIVRLPLVQAVAQTRAVASLISQGRFEEAARARGDTFIEMQRLVRVLADPSARQPGTDADAPPRGQRVGVLHAGGLAPGMNPAVRAAVRLGVAQGFTMLGITGSFAGLLKGEVTELGWGDVDDWIMEGGAILGTARSLPTVEQLYAISRAVEEHRIDALLIIGGFTAYQAALTLVSEQNRYPAFRMPIVCVPASLDNNLPGAELSIGADTALNEAVSALDKIKQSASASRRCFVAETMGRRCGYLTLTAGLAAGAERIYLHELGVRLSDLEEDIRDAVSAFRQGRRLFLAIRNERASDAYTTPVIATLFAAESDGLYDVREAVIGHQQQGGRPTPFDRILAARLVRAAISDLAEQFATGSTEGRYLGHVHGQLRATPLAQMSAEVDLENRRPREQWWMNLLPVLAAVGNPLPDPPGIGAPAR